MTQYRIAVLVHANQVLEDTRNYQPINCTDYDHPLYSRARQVDDERCHLCRRDVKRAHLRLIK